jgi:hypothetical protein
MTTLIATLRLAACEEVGIGLSAFGRSSSVPVAILAIASDLLKRLVQTRRRLPRHALIPSLTPGEAK